MRGSRKVFFLFFCFRNGSVKVRFRVVVKVDKSDEKEPLIVAKKVGKTLRVNVKDGKIGSLKVKPTVEFRGLFNVFLSSFLPPSLPPSLPSFRLIFKWHFRFRRRYRCLKVPYYWLREQNNAPRLCPIDTWLKKNLFFKVMQCTAYSFSFWHNLFY